jgi:predicted CoA-binding protein/two-component sensor histidine kinase
MGLVQADLTERFSGFSDEELGSIAALLTAQHSVYSLMEEVEQGAKQISQIVKALKTYAYLDQAPVQMIDVHEGLDNTLVMLRGEMKGIEVRRDYAEDLPRIQAYGSELNQVWTNIIDNAIDALEGAENSPGEILIRTRAEGEWVVVQIQDNGPGIPPEIQSKVFEPFFTTKDVGKGTGLGLDISYNIVVQKHRGDIRMTSEPGNTCFEIWLPTDFEKVESGEITVPGMEMINDEIKRKILTSSHNVAVVGMSTRPNVPAHTVPVFLHSKGYNIIPVRPDGQEVLGMQSYPDLASVPDPIDVVLVFRRSEDVPVVVHQAVAVGAKVVWMQEGIVNEAAAAVARNAGLQVVMDTCMRKEYRRLIESS